jgi:hypothetical protein
VTKYRIYQWEDIQDIFKQKLLLGNGASRAVWESFKYPSLYEEAKKAGRIDLSLTKLFSDFGTSDFEYILRLLSQTKRVNKTLHIQDGNTPRLYRKLKKTLIDTVRDIHPTHEQVKNFLLPMAQFMKRFDTVLSLNYDLLVYWAMLDGNDKYGNWFKDGFVDEGRFDNDYHALHEPYLSEDATLVFYPHGNLILATEFLGDEVKLSRLGKKYLLDEILKIWEERDHIPLFVSEGETEEKLQAIRRSNYLKTVYDYEIDTRSDSLVIYGWSFRDEDEHILKGIVNGGIDGIAVSVHTGSRNAQSFCETVKYKINKMHYTLNKERKCKVYFFDSESNNVWINRLEEIVL